jgi:integrin alpha FG-GAP repeat containing protein 1
MIGLALTGTCGQIIEIIAALDWNKKLEDSIEKLQEAHRFHFDAM